MGGGTKQNGTELDGKFVAEQFLVKHRKTAGGRMI